jgi:hypothetical protein
MTQKSYIRSRFLAAHEKAERALLDLKARRDFGENIENKISEDQVDFALETLADMKRQLETESLPPLPRESSLAHILVDSWPWGHPVGNLVSEVVGLYKRKLE